MRATFRWTRSHPKTAAVLLLLAALVLLNLLAYRHAWAMTHFVAGGGTKRRPEGLSAAEKVGVLLNGIRLGRPEGKTTPADVGLAYETHSFAGEDGPLSGWWVPRADARGVVVLFHGYADCKASLVPEARAFHDLGYACFLADLRGCGGSAGDATTLGYREADDVGRAIDHVRGLGPRGPLVLFGRSLGAAAVLRALAVGRAEADAVILECPFDRMLSAVEARFALMGVPAFPAARLLVFWGGVQHGFDAFAHNPADYARAVTCPVLLLSGTADRRAPAAGVEAVYANLAGPKERHAFEGLDHESYLAKRPGEWAGCVRAFLGREFRQ